MYRDEPVAVRGRPDAFMGIWLAAHGLLIRTHQGRLHGAEMSVIELRKQLCEEQKYVCAYGEYLAAYTVVLSDQW